MSVKLYMYIYICIYMYVYILHTHIRNLDIQDIYERETSVGMCYTITVKQKTQRLFDEFSYSFNT